MRLTCPNCTAEYDIADGMLPPGGRHVQCTACHTRWFVRGVSGTGLTEDQILSRLETWTPRPAPAPVSPVAVAPAAVVPMPLAAVPKAPPPAPGEGEASGPARDADRDAEPPVVVHLPPRPSTPAKPSDRPAPVSRPAPVNAPANAPVLAPVLAPAPRLDLGEPAQAAAPAPPAPDESRFGRGLLVGLVIAGLALATYVYRAPLAARAPAAAPALAAYGDTVDAWRSRLEAQLAPFRDADRP